MDTVKFPDLGGSIGLWSSGIARRLASSAAVMVCAPLAIHSNDRLRFN
jgi:hypothetical protein